MKTTAAIVVLVASVAAFGEAEVRGALSEVEFVPPNDPTGAVTSTDSNDGYILGRGLVFEMTGDQVIYEVGILHDLADVNLSYEIAETITTSGNVSVGQTILRSGSQTVTTSGLQWIDLSIDPLALEMGKSYHIEFSHSGNGNQNFFYDNENVRFSTGPFSLLDGTQFGNTENFTMPAIRVVVPEPSAITLAVLGLLGVGWRLRKRK